MGHDISIKETIEDKNSWYNVKRFRIGNTDFDRPQKGLDAKVITKEKYDSFKINEKLKFSEATKIITSYSTIDDVCNEDEDTKINAFFCKKNWLGDVPNVLNLTFEFNPFKSVGKIDKMAGFFDMVLSVS